MGAVHAHAIECLDTRRRRTWRNARLKRKPHCHYCNCKLTKATATVDHVEPLSKGGADDESNWVLSCQPCNHDKDDKVL